MVQDQDTWTRVEHAMSNFALMMGGVMAIAAARSAAGQQPGAPVPQVAPHLRALVADRLGKPQLDRPTFDRVRAGLGDDEAAELIAACAAYAGDLPPLTAPLGEPDMLAYIQRPGPGDDAFEAFVARFMAIGVRIQRILERAPGT